MVVTTHVVVRCAVAGAGLVLALSAPAQSQGLVPQAGEIVRAVKLSGPRFGVTTLSAGIVDSLSDDYDIDLSPVITQFGWQFEKRFYCQPSGFTAVTEWVLLVGGMEQGQFLPSVSWLVGVRTAGGVEFGAGPNVTAAGLGLALAGGATFRAGSLNVPVNLAVVPSRSGVRVSVLTGFNVRR